MAETTAKNKPAVTESVYTVEEFAANAQALNATKGEVRVALRLAGKQIATMEEAKRIVDAFKKKEV